MKLADTAKNFMTEHDVSMLFDYFCKNVLKDRTCFNGHELVSLFSGILFDMNNYHQDADNENILLCNGDAIGIDGKSFSELRSRTCGLFSENDISFFKGAADRLIEDADRRMRGDFWTPTIFVDYGHSMIEDAIGTDWKKTCVVWDNCWGSGNLTRDYVFDDLYCSTLFESELDIGRTYNTNSEKFQFDFLNDGIPIPGDLLSGFSKLPEKLVNSFREDKSVVFFINPPYGTVNNMGFGGTSKSGIAETLVNKQMLDANAGACAKNLYAQFLYRIMKIKQSYKLTKCHICLYSPTLFMTGPSFRVFRKSFLKEFSFVRGCQFRANHFSNVSHGWGISFTIWKSGETHEKDRFSLDLIDDVCGEIKTIGKKTLYNTDFCKSGNNWIKETVYGKKTYDAPQMSSAINVKQTGRCVVTKDALGYFVTNSNNVDSSVMSVALFSSAYSRPCGYSITESNFTRCVALFSARKLVTRNWINSKDEFFAPDENSGFYDEFVKNSIVYSLFHQACNFTSLRNVEYKGMKWDICNNFFWMPKDEIMEMSEKNGMTKTYEECRISDDRYLFIKTKDIVFPEESRIVIEKANNIVRNTFRYRKSFNSVYPEYQIMNWDCGWYQIREIAKKHDMENYDDFVSAFKNLERKMLPMVYELGFLKK